VTATEQGVTGTEYPLLSRPRKGSVLASWLSSTDHKIIGYLYLITSFCFFLFAGILAMIMRAQLMGPNNHIVSDQQYNELFTMHGTIMLLLFATPLFVGFTNVIMPLQIGAPSRGSTCSATTCSPSAGSSWWPAS
jgi:cytochrome c oxidase subunit 1